jgi:Ca2+-binding EF-hand superfamily protein
MIRNAGMEPKFPVKISAIQDGMKAARNNWNRNGSPLGLPGSASGGQTPAGENGEAKSEAKTTPLVPGFGVEQKKAEVPGFGATVKTSTTASEGAASGDQPAGTPETPANVPNQIDERTRKFAESYLKQRDKNKSGVLERDKGEWDEVPDAKSIDRNHDNVIAQDEMIIYFLEKNGRPAPRPKGPENPAAAKAVTPSNSSKNGSVYRLLSPQERLPDGLPDWFLRCDTDADGQIAMSEYARDWTAEKAKEFARYDLNGDGTITPQEFLQTK